MGINPELFRWELKPSEVFDTPEVIMSYSSNGMEKLSHNFHKVIREHVCRGKYKLAERPVLINNWEATYFDFNEEKILKIAEQAASLGVDMLVLDDGWFGKRDDDCSGLGDWFVSEEKLNGGLGKLAEKIKSLGMKFGLWFEPEMVSEDSDLYRSHPDWAIKIPSRNPVRSRYQLVLDMINPEVRDYLFGAISDILKNADISYIKWDMNRSICDWYTPCLSAENQGEMPHRYVLGLYELLEQQLFLTYFLRAAAVAADGLTQVCFTIVRRYGAAMIRTLLSGQRYSTEHHSSIPCLRLVLTFPQCRITRRAGLRL